MSDLIEAAAALAARCRTEPALRHTSSLLVAHQGAEVVACDLHGVGLDEPVPGIASITKSLVSTLAGCADVIWPADPEGVPYGFGGARLSPRALLRFGEAWRTGAAVPAGYRDLAWTAHTADGAPIHRGYGYLWWIGEEAGIPVHAARVGRAVRARRAGRRADRGHHRRSRPLAGRSVPDVAARAGTAGCRGVRWDHGTQDSLTSAGRPRAPDTLRVPAR